MIDFDAVVRDSADPRRFLPLYHPGDWLHPNDAGYRAMGEANRPDALHRAALTARTRRRRGGPPGRAIADVRRRPPGRPASRSLSCRQS